MGAYTIPSNPLRAYLDSEAITLEAFGVILGRIANGGRAIAPSVIRRYSLPFDHPQFIQPPRKRLMALPAATGGAVQPADFFPAAPKRSRAA